MSQAAVNGIAVTLFEDAETFTENDRSPGYVLLQIENEQKKINVLRHNNALTRILNADNKHALASKLLDGLKTCQDAAASKLQTDDDLRDVLAYAYTKWKHYDQSE